MGIGFAYRGCKVGHDLHHTEVVGKYTEVACTWDSRLLPCKAVRKFGDSRENLFGRI